ncbi:MAG: ROK family protein [Pyrinomonadaceae bacterium]
MSSQSKTLGIEVSSNFLRAVAVSSDDSISEAVVEPRFDGSDPLDRIVTFVGTALAKLGPVDAIGVAIPGLINRENGGVAYSANMPEAASLNIAEAVGEAASVPVLLENDANAAAVAEHEFGAGRGSSSMFYATIGDGVGGAFILDGKLWQGAGGYAGEFGYIAIDSEGTRLEEMASTVNIVRRTRSRFNRDSTSSLGKLPEERIGIADIVKAADEGDEFARLMLERTGTYVGTAIANVINLLNLETIVVGGEITGAKDIVVEAITNRAKELSFARAFAQTTIVAATLGDDAAAIGAALIARPRA